MGVMGEVLVRKDDGNRGCEEVGVGVISKGVMWGVWEMGAGYGASEDKRVWKGLM